MIAVGAFKAGLEHLIFEFVWPHPGVTKDLDQGFVFFWVGIYAYFPSCPMWLKIFGLLNSVQLLLRVAIPARITSRARRTSIIQPQ